MNDEENQEIIESTITITEEINNKKEDHIPFNEEKISKNEKNNDLNEDINIENHTNLITEKMNEPNDNDINMKLKKN